MSDIDSYLKSNGVHITPNHSKIHSGYISEAQKRQFSDQLGKYGSIRKIGEIGFNAGHSADHFFQVCKDLELFVSFDINKHLYTKCAVAYFTQKYGARFQFIEGDSLLTVPLFPPEKFDLIYIDGCHVFDWVVGDLMNMKNFAHRHTVVWIDDVPRSCLNSVGAAVKFCESLNVLQVKEYFESNDPQYGMRYWAEAMYRT